MLTGFSFTADVRAALTRARNEALGLGHPYIGTEHLLLGVLGPNGAVSASLLALLDVSKVRADGERLAGAVLVPGEPGWDFRLPERSSVLVALARALWAGVTNGEPAAVLVWVTDWGMRGAGEHLPLMEAARRGLGAMRPMIQTPGHLAAAAESEAGLSILMLVLLFGWDAWLLPTGGYPAVYVGNDGYGSFTARGDATLIRQCLSEFELSVTNVRRAEV